MTNWTSEENLKRLERWANKRLWLGQQVREALPQLIAIARKAKKDEHAPVVQDQND